MNDYQMSFRGVTFGGLDNPTIGIIRVNGLQDYDSITGDSELPRADGDIPGYTYSAGKDIILELSIEGERGSSVLAKNLDTVRALFSRSIGNRGEHPEILTYKIPGQSARSVFVRPIAHSEQNSPQSEFGMKTVLVRMRQSDPRTYSTTVNSKILAAFSGVTGGLDLAITEYPKEFTVDSGTLQTIRNKGTKKAWPIIAIYGPIVGTATQFTITNITSGQTATVFDITMLTDQVLTADMHNIITATPSDNHVIRLGTTNRYSGWAQPRDPFFLLPGDNNIKFEVSGGTSVDCICSFTYRDTW